MPGINLDEGNSITFTLGGKDYPSPMVSVRRYEAEILPLMADMNAAAAKAKDEKVKPEEAKASIEAMVRFVRAMVPAFTEDQIRDMSFQQIRRIQEALMDRLPKEPAPPSPAKS